ncbi:hypothetical protein I5Q34_30795 [Streptomyces sp. AV19]|uniref:hypothetical protein n=1 Tax=Streptomyces sp. AV19 TaxID=2793068 RepID=UPI0018FE7C32|nr:hypothetical protein [Streptomyces sp. AV19]MBH1938596.1 hypothetical protein [Streptomyces sp. AV19]MDG4535240.1 hypothetical protein [Streptomyces sp. AV19]
MDDKAESAAKAKGRRLDLSVAQVAGSALAAVVAALLAGKLGVYGTVIGAGVVSVVATTGGTVFQHLFRRTGEQVRDAATQAARPKPRQVPVDGATRMPPEAHAGAYPGVYGDARSGAVPPGLSGQYSEGTTHGTRLRGWKRPLLAAGAVFVLAMGTVTAVELVSGTSADGKKDEPTILRPFQGGGGKSEQKKGNDGPGQDPGTHRTPGAGSSGTDSGSASGGGQDDGKDGASSSPGTSGSSGGSSGGQTPDPGGSPSGGSSPSPGKSPDASGSPDAGSGGTSGGKTTGGSGDGGTPPATQQPPAGGAGGATSAP